MKWSERDYFQMVLMRSPHVCCDGVGLLAGGGAGQGWTQVGRGRLLRWGGRAPVGQCVVPVPASVSRLAIQGVGEDIATGVHEADEKSAPKSFGTAGQWRSAL
jgi:hypothetical protein